MECAPWVRAHNYEPPITSRLKVGELKRILHSIIFNWARKLQPALRRARPEKKAAMHAGEEVTSRAGLLKWKTAIPRLSGESHEGKKFRAGLADDNSQSYSAEP